MIPPTWKPSGWGGGGSQCSEIFVVQNGKHVNNKSDVLETDSAFVNRHRVTWLPGRRTLLACPLSNWNVRLIRPHCQRGAWAGMSPPLSFPKLIPFLLKLDASQLFLSCPYGRAISMTLVPKYMGTESHDRLTKSGVATRCRKAGAPGHTEWPQGDFLASIFPVGKAHHSLPGPMMGSLWRSKEVS